MFYSKSTGGFYSTEIHGTNIPTDAVAITQAQHEALMAAQSSGQIIQADKNGNPIAVLPAPNLNDAIYTQLNAIDLKSIRALREGDATRVTALEAQAVALRGQLV